MDGFECPLSAYPHSHGAAFGQIFRARRATRLDGNQRMQARAYGLGAPGEVVFSLPQDAPSPPPITPLGARTTTHLGAADTPLDAWLKIIFGN